VDVVAWMVSRRWRAGRRAAAEALGPRGALLGAVAVLLSGTVAAWLSPPRTAARGA
jgi:hypothetical protein